MFIKTFSEISKEDVKEVGGKGASLGEMTKIGIPVPPGFVVTTETYKQFIDSEIPVDVREEILRAFDKLGATRVAVRSSAVAEDSSTASWAGQLESYLNVTRDELIKNIKRCWESIKSERAYVYANEQGSTEDDLVVAVVVQKMVDADAAGVMFTKNPITKDENQIMIEACWGLGELLVQGQITPDNYIINIDSRFRGNDKEKSGNDNSAMEITSKDIRTQGTMLVFQGGENKEIPVPNGDKEALTDRQVIELAKLGKKIEAHYGKPQDIEWVFEKGKFYIVQSRPITT